MALVAKIQFGNNDIGRYNKEYLVSDVRCHFTRSHNNKQPDSSARCESISFTVVAPDKKDPLLYQWYINMSCMTGRILFINPEASNDNEYYKSIYFEEARCLSFREQYDIHKNQRRRLTVSFEAESIEVNDIEFLHL